MSSIVVNFVLIIASLLAFCILRHRYPLVYSNNLQTGVVARTRFTDGCFGWIHDALYISSEEVERTAGLDAAMLLEFCGLCMKILAAIGLPMLLIMSPLNAFAGKQPVDRLSKLGMGSVQPGSWLCRPHTFFVWYVVVVSQLLIFRAQRSFLDRRYAWLRAMPAPQSTTVLVENIPPECCSDGELLRKFQGMFGTDSVKEAFVVKRTRQLASLVAAEKAVEQSLHEEEFKWEKDGRDPAMRPHFYSCYGERRDSLEHYEALRKESAEAVTRERTRIQEDVASGDPAVYASSGFVTFGSRRDQELALMVAIAFDEDEFVTLLPPDPSDVIYDDLMEDPSKRAGREFLGRACILGLYVGFMPFVVGTSQLTNLRRLEERFPAIKDLLEGMPSAEPMVDSMLSVIALKFFMMFLPTFLMLIFQQFFCLRAEAWAQHKLQSSYFWFLAVFEILVTSVGSSLTHTTGLLIKHPLHILVLLANTLPKATHFYLNYMVFNWGTHAMNLTRYVNLMKFWALRAVCEEERARELSEPEDQDYYGFGGRSARFAECMVMALVFCSLSPLITALALVNFFICKVVYGYLLVYAETRKADLGGHFWVTQLDHLQKGLVIYVATMVGVLFEKGRSRRPCTLALGALIYLAFSYRKFHAMRWQTLPFQELANAEKAEGHVRRTTRETYVQPELLD